MNLKHLVNLVRTVSKGKVIIPESACGINNYGFAFKDIECSNSPYIHARLSSKLCSIGAHRDIIKRLESNQIDKISHIDDLLQYDERYDLLFAASLKTLLPNIRFGGDELLFRAWVFANTPKGDFFPITFYYGPSGFSLGGWTSRGYEKVFPKDFFSVITTSPFNYSPSELEELVEALELTLRNIPISDFHGLYQHDEGYYLMGVKESVPFIFYLGASFNELDINNYLNSIKKK